jgi:hypothetical protein
MFLATTNKPKRLLYLSYIQRVRGEDLKHSREEVATLLADLPAGFRLLTDLGRLEYIDAACVTEIGKMMELCDQQGVGLVVRVIPDPRKDFGMNILSMFHYRRQLRVVTCKTMEEAAKLLSL